MEPFPIADDVVELVKRLAKPAPFELFSDALRRVLLPLDQAPKSHSLAQTPAVIAADSGRPIDSRALLQPQSSQVATPSPPAVAGRGRAPKADLRELVRLGLLKEGQELYLVDFRGQRHPSGRATITGGDLRSSDGHLHSMSSLASDLLKEQGYVADAVRGPEHWVTSDGKKVRELWEGALRRRVK